MIVTIEHWNGTIFTVEVNPTDYVDDLKEKIEEEQSIPVDTLRFTLNGTPLEDMDTLEENNMTEDCTLVMQPLKVNLILPTNKKLRVSFKPSDLVKKIKRGVSKKTGNDPDTLTFVFDGHELTDGQTMGEANVEHDDTITIESFTLRVSHWDGEIFVFKDINPRSTIDVVKQLVFEKAKVPLEDQKFLHDERPVNEFLSLRDQQINHKAVLDMPEPKTTVKKEKFKLAMLPTNTPKEMTETVKGTLTIKHWDGRSFEVSFSPSEYVDDVKERLLSEHQVPVAHQRLSFNGEEVDETEPLEDQGIESGATLVMEPLKCSIQAPNQKKPFKVAFQPSDKIKRVKRIVAKKCGIQADVQLVFCDGKEFKDTQSFEECGIEHGALLEVILFAIVVEHWEDGEFEINDIRPSDSPDDLKQIIEEKQNIPKAQVKIKFNDAILNDFISLRDQGVNHQSRLELVEPEKKVEKREKFKLQLFGAGGASSTAATKKTTGTATMITLNIKKSDGDIVEIEFDPSDYVEALKEKIHEACDIPIEQIRLSFDGKLLDGADTLKENNIEDGAELVMEPMTLSLILPTGKGFKMKARPEDTIKKVKRIVAKKKKLEADKLCIMYDGTELEDGKTLYGCGIEDGEKLKIELFELSVAHWSGDVFVLDDCHPDDTSDDIKLVIQKRRKIPLSDQNFKYNGKPINAFLSLKAQGIGHKAVLIMEDPQPNGLFSPKSPRPTISHLKEVDADDELDDDDLSDASSVASWLKEAAMNEEFTAELCKVEASEDSWMGKEAAKEAKKAGNKKKKGGTLKIPEL